MLDSGLTSHMVNDQKLFTELVWKKSDIIWQLKTEKMKAKELGTVETENCIKKDVLYVPELSKNLLSLSAIIRNGGQVVFADDKAEVQKNGKRFIAQKTRQGLWIVNLEINKTKCVDGTKAGNDL